MDFFTTAIQPNQEISFVSEPVVNNTDNFNETKSQQQNSFDSPAAELILSNGLQKQIQGLTFSARTAVMNASASQDTEKMNMMMKQCFALHNKVNSNSISKGQKTYIQSEINRIKRSISGFDIAL